jgi:hypothetical protein
MQKLSSRFQETSTETKFNATTPQQQNNSMQQPHNSKTIQCNNPATAKQINATTPQQQNNSTQQPRNSKTIQRNSPATAKQFNATTPQQQNNSMQQPRNSKTIQCNSPATAKQFNATIPQQRNAPRTVCPVSRNRVRKILETSARSEHTHQVYRPKFRIHGNSEPGFVKWSNVVSRSG